MSKGTGLPQINHRLRVLNRALPTPRLLQELGNALPGLQDAAMIVGRWVWLVFDDVPAVEIRRRLSQLGFHWNRARQAWQHPCGTFRSHLSTREAA